MLYVGGLGEGDDVSPDDLAGYFNQFGELENTPIVMKGRGFGFITYKEARIAFDVRDFFSRVVEYSNDVEPLIIC